MNIGKKLIIAIDTKAFREISPIFMIPLLYEYATCDVYHYVDVRLWDKIHAEFVNVCGRAQHLRDF